MKTLDELKELYNKQLLHDLNVLEKKRKLVFQLTVVLFLFTATITTLIVLIIKPEDNFFFTVCFYVAVFLSIFVSCFRYFTKKYRNEFKQRIIRKILHFIEPRLQYFPEKNINREQLLDSKLFHDSLTEIEGDDFVCGKIKKTSVCFSEVHAVCEAKNISFFLKNKNWRFDGLFFIADFNKNFVGATLLISKKSKLKEFIHNSSKLFQKNCLDNIKLDNIEFHDKFTTYSTDKVESNYILSTSLMERILDFQKKTGSNVFLSFIDSKVNIAIPKYEMLFEPRYFRSIVSFEPIRKYFEDLQLAIGIVEDLDLNTRIWTKE